MCRSGNGSHKRSRLHLSIVGPGCCGSVNDVTFGASVRLAGGARSCSLSALSNSRLAALDHQFENRPRSTYGDVTLDIPRAIPRLFPMSATVSSSVPIVSKLEISATNERSRFRVWLKGPSRSQTVEFDLIITPQQAMILMRTLEAFRRKYRWPVPLDPKIERLFC